MMRGHATVRAAIRVRGIVQGVGFRPAVYRIARACGLAGLVRNDGEGVWIELEGDRDAVAAFPRVLVHAAPPLARIDAIETSQLAPTGESEFRVDASDTTEKAQASIPADIATCDPCLSELLDPQSRRYRYPFINCTDCGPRYTIVCDLPYDRARTTMDRFAMCTTCHAEYDDPANRRFHAEPNACPACGPQVALLEGGSRTEGDLAMQRAARLLAEGAIVALKGLGGYQLATSAFDDRAVRLLRTRKHRPHKPFALLARDLAVVERVAQTTAIERDALLSRARPIVLLEAKERVLAPSIAPGLRELGIMLPATPLHHLLVRDGDPILVMTSGNLSDEPIAKDDDDALERLRGIADAFLVDDRPIHTRADDSVMRRIAGVVRPVRRARGHAPASLLLGSHVPSVLAVGAELKNTVCLTRGREAFLSQHIGDLGTLEARAFFEEVISKLGRVLGVEPAVVAHDLHPDYASTQWALACGLPRVPVQHHHAHVAACLAEHGRSSKTIGIAFDGTGCGPAGDAWGGEILVFDLASCERRGHLRPLALPGGEAAIREPWRIAVAALLDARASLDVLSRIPAKDLETVRRMIGQGVAAPLATGAGRWFDAIAAMAGIRDVVSYEAQAAIELEADAALGDPYPFEVADATPFVIDLRPTVRAVVASLARGEPVAGRFHATLAAAITTACVRVRAESGLRSVALSGGCFQNRLLVEETKRRLELEGFEVLLHERVPANDGGVAFGQAAVAAFCMRKES